LNITEVRVKLMEARSDRLRAFCSVTIDNDFVVHDLRVIEGKKGRFVAMPSRRLTDSCPHCGAKNHLRAKFCNECGHRLDERRAGSNKVHVDVAHPINTPCRKKMQAAVLAAFEENFQRRQEGLAPSRDYVREDLESLAGESEEVPDIENHPEEPDSQQGSEEDHGFGEGIL